ncbi:hypothetical protein MMC21_000689 [Puttea exsequens]|nr:hypothetical protein [Puttea exsequens]
MEHSTHAHPLPDGRHGSPRQESTPPPSTPLSSPTAIREDLSQQNRRLQLRNLGFRGTVLPFRRFSPLSGASIEPFARSVNTENIPPNTERRLGSCEELSYSPINILQELHNSTRKRHTPPRPGLCAIFEDDTGDGETGDPVSPTSWYKEGSAECSPAIQIVRSASMMKLRETSLNERTPPPLSSPLAKHVKGRHLRRGMRSPSAETSKYIEHLESQLASTNARIESPGTVKKRAAKLRALTAENRSLRHELSDWEKEFGARLQEERNQRHEEDMELRSRIRALEHDIELKEARVSELEWEIESMRAKVRNAEGLEATNEGLEKRIDTLTSLLAQSPKRPNFSASAISPDKESGDLLKRTPRPRSMLPRMPSIPQDAQSSLDTVLETTTRRSNSFEPSSSVTGTPEKYEDTILDARVFQTPTFATALKSPNSARPPGHSSYIESRSRRSTFHQSAPSSSSRPQSFRSSASFGPASWGWPSVEDSIPKPSNKSRKMRRFPSGAGSLKPLILPTATMVPSLPASAPVYSSAEIAANCDISEASLDSTSAFLSTPIDISPFSTPLQPSRPQSTSEAQEEALMALEGKISRGGWSDVSSLSHPSLTRFREHSVDLNGTPLERLSRPRSLQKELEEAISLETEGEQAVADSDLQYHRKYSSPAEFHDVARPTPTSLNPNPRRPPSMHSLRCRRASKDSDSTPKSITDPMPSTFNSSRSTKALTSATLTPQYAQGICSRLTSLITRTKQDPLTLARRLLANAWIEGANQFGGVAWWLLGVLYHRSKWREHDRTANDGVAEEDHAERMGSFHWQHYSAEASRRRAAEQYLRDCCGTHERRKRDTWLSPPHISHSRLDSQIVPPMLPSPFSHEEPQLFPCPDCQEPSSRRTIRLWLRFSFTIVLAVGLAVKNGPSSLLNHIPTDCSELAPELGPLLQSSQRRRHPHAQDLLIECADVASQPSRDSRVSSGADSGYGSITFAEVLGPADFES